MPSETSSLVFLNYLSTVFDNIEDAVLLVGIEPNNKYRLLLANKVFYKISGFPVRSVGKEITDIVGPEGFAFLSKQYQIVIQSRKPHRYLKWSDVPAGRLAFEVKMLPILNAVGECTQIIVIIHDVSEREKLRQEVIDLRERLDKPNS